MRADFAYISVGFLVGKGDYRCETLAPAPLPESAWHRGEKFVHGVAPNQRLGKLPTIIYDDWGGQNWFPGESV